MRAIQVVSHEGPGAVQLADVPEPVPGPGELLVHVAAAGVSYPDVLLSRGRYQYSPPLPFIPGSEVAGRVVVAPAGGDFAVGDRVTGFTLLGGFAERAVVPVGNAYRLPDSIDFISAAGLPMNYLTVQFALSRRGRLRAGETVLVHGAAGGVGTAALQWARWQDARSIAVVSTEDKIEVARAAGAGEVVLAHEFLSRTKELTGGRGVDVVVDPVGGERFTDSLRSLAPEGRLLVVGFTAGDIPTVKVNRLLLNNLEVVGVAWGAMALAVPGFMTEQWAALDPGIRAGVLAPPIGAVYPLDAASAALEELSERRVHGKVVLGTES